jgi:capsular polysaccharide biosynthesis protein
VEVGTFLRATLRRWWIVLLVVVLAGAVAFVATLGTKDTYDGAVVLTVPAVQASTTGSNAQYVENFQTTLTISQVIDQVSHDTKVSTDDLSSGLASSQLNNSSYIEVTYNGTTSAQAKAVVVSAAKRTAAYLARSVTEAAKAAHDSAVAAATQSRKQLDAAQKTMDAFVAKYGPGDPSDALQSAQSSINQLSVSRLQAIANNRSTKGFDTAIATARKQVQTLGPLVRTFNSASQKLKQAQGAYSDAQAKSASTAQALATAESTVLLDTPTADLVKSRSVVIKAMAIAAGIGLVLGLGLAMLLAALRRDKPRGRRRRRVGTAAASTEADDDHEPVARADAVGGHRAPTGSGADLEKV